jgi:heavy metal translocating P-type ATPase
MVNPDPHASHTPPGNTTTSTARIKATRGSCDLCGQPITGAPISGTFDGVEKHFCCQGCARVYTVAHDKGMLDEILPATTPTKPAFTDLILTRGESASFSITGMWCAGCATAAEELLRHSAGVKSADISFAAERGRIEYDPKRIDPATLLQGLDPLGYQARLLSNGNKQSEKQEENLLLQLIASAAFGMQVMLFYFVQLYPMYAQGQFNDPVIRRIQYITWALATPVFLVGGSTFLRGAWRALRARTATMDTLVAMGIMSAYLYSVFLTITGHGQVYFDSVVMITTFIMFGRYLEKIGGAQARKDIRSLLTIQPTRAQRRTPEGWEEVDSGALVPGDVIMTRAGERIAADVRVLEGHSTVNESSLTGESLPVGKDPSDTAFAGTLVEEGLVVGKVLNLSGESRLAQITHLVEKTLATKPRIQRLVDRVSTYFALGIIITALLTLAGWYVASRSLSIAILAAVSVLVVACPCALGLATPLALAVSLGQATRAGILIRNLEAMENAGRLNQMIFDKTGTLTQGKLAVTAGKPAADSNLSVDELTCLAAQVEQYSMHPIAIAIVNACAGPLPAAADFESLRGIGASARVEYDPEHRLLVGSDSLVSVDPGSPLAIEAANYAGRGETIVWLGWGDRVAGFLSLRDTLNTKAANVIAQLKTMGIQPVMLSGDNAVTTAAIAEELHLEVFEGGFSPESKAEYIRNRQSEGLHVAMVGDGVNDAPALAQADFSITVWGGTDVAGETSDIVLTRADLELIPSLIGLSRRTRSVIIQNLGWAFAYNLLAVPLAVFGVISPAIAAGAMATSSLLVVGNSLRLSHINMST